MKASKTALVAALALGSLGLLAGSVSACGGGGGYGGGYGGYSSHHHHKVYVKKVYVRPVHVHVEPCYHPFHCFAIVNPGDTWFTLSLREYGKPHLWKKIAIFNGLPLNAGLVPGMQLKLPVIHPGGVLLPSSAPAPIALAGPTPGGPIGLPNGGGIPQANFIPQGAPTGAPQMSFAPQAGSQANFAQSSSPQMGAQNFAGPTGTGPQGATSMGAPNMLQGNGPMMQNFGGSNASQPNGAPQNFGAPNMIPQNFGQPNGLPQNGPALGQPNVDTSAMAPIAPVAPTANIRTVARETVAIEKRLPNVAIGSILSLDGQSLGTERGTVRLKVNGLALPIEVLEWSTTSVKIQLPQLELAGAIKAEIEVLRADGSLASKSAVELTTATSRLALGN